MTLLTGAGISQPTIEQTFRLGEFAGDTVNPKEPLVLLLTMTDASFLVWRCRLTPGRPQVVPVLTPDCPCVDPRLSPC